MMSLFFLLGSLVLAALANPYRATVRWNQNPFVSINGTSFTVNGTNFGYIGTNLYWLPALNTDEDIWYTLGNISALGARVVRVWAFNDVDVAPTNGTYFQIVQNGTVSINDGPNGLQKLDTVIQMAEQHGLYVILSLTNNWNPLPPLNITDPVGSAISIRDVTSGINNSLPRNYLSNNYGGMDLYVRQFGFDTHDQFYTSPSILNSFLNFTTQVVSRYVNSPAIFSWELANDPRCNSTLPAGPGCTTETITRWHATVAAHVRSIDPNHLISAGTSGYLCTDCPKLYPLNPSPAPAPLGPSASPAPGTKKRRKVVPVTTGQILRERAKSRRRTREAAIRAGTVKQDGVRIRGRWTATRTRRQESQGVGSVYDGSYGVDSQDILNIPEIGFGSFMLFPDQQFYGLNDPYVDAFTNTLNLGIDWILKQAQSGTAVGKPSVLTAFGLVTRGNAPNFVPFNMSTALFPNASSNSNFTYGVTNQQQTDAYSTWTHTGITAGLGGIVQYQWGQKNLTAETGTTISPGVTGISQDSQTTPISPNDDTTGISPNDGYSSNGNNGVQQVMQTGVQQYAAN